MSGKQLQRVYNQHDWDTATRLEKILIHVIEPDLFPLSARDDKHYQRMQRCYTIMLSTFSETSRMALLRKEFHNMNSRAIGQLKNDVMTFYDKFDEQTKKFNWTLQHERILKHLELAIEENDLQSVGKFESILQKMRAEMPEDIIEEEELIPDFEFTTDPRYLEGDQEIDYEEITEEE